MSYIYKKPYCEFGKLVYDVGTEKCRCRIKTKKIKTATKTEKCSAKKKEECALKNKICNTKTNRCNKPKTVKKKKNKTVKRKQSLKQTLQIRSPASNQRQPRRWRTKTVTKTKKCPTKKKEECALKNKICNEKTNRCNNPPKTVKRKQKIEVIKTITPSLHQSIVKLEKKMDSIKNETVETNQSLRQTWQVRSPSYSPWSIEKVKTPTKPEKCSTKKKEECALKNKICNEKTNRCNNPPKTVKKKKVDRKKKKTVKRKQSLRQNKKDEYSPSVNKKLLTLREITPKSYIHNCDGMDIVVKIKNKNKCMKWTSKKAKKVLLDNLLSNRPIKCDNIIAPKQFQSNCWMNTFFMAWFISDKGRKFNRWFRQTMITGVDPNGKEINKKLKKPLWLLNKMIDASIYGSRIGDNGVRFSSLMDTNEIIRLIFMVDPKNLVKTKTAFNPFTFYKSIYNLLPGNFLSWGMIRFGGDGKFITSKNEATAEMSNTFNTWHNNNILPKVLFVSYSDTVSSVEKQQSIKFIFNEKEKITYKLDAVIIRNIKKHHFSACITCSGKEYGFDGASYSPMQPFKWKNKLNKDVKWRFAEQHNMFFNFKEGYQILMYYRV